MRGVYCNGRNFYFPTILLFFKRCFSCYNLCMKRLFTAIIILGSMMLPVFADDIIEDYMDIVSNDCVLGDYADAVIYLDKIIKMTPNNEDFKKLKSLLYQLGTTNQKSFISGYNMQLDKAFSAKLTGDRVGEENALKEAAASGNFWAYSYLGDYFRQNKKYGEAIDAYFKAYELQPSFTQALLAIAECYLESGQYDMVNEPIRRFLYQNQQSDVAYAIRAKAYMMQGQMVDAETEIVTALALNDDVEYNLLYGIILTKKNNYQKAINILTKVAKEVQTSDVYKYLGFAYLGIKDYNNAMLNMDKAIILSNDDNELKTKYNETKNLIKNMNAAQLQNEERAEVKNIYEQKKSN